MAEFGRQELIIQTPEGVRFAFDLAGPFSRFVAWLVDVGLIFGITVTLSSILQVIAVFSTDVATAVVAIATATVTFAYRMIMEWRCKGQTIGKRLLRLQVMDARGLRLEPSQVIIRNLLRIVDALPVGYMVGGIAVLCGRHAQRLGDMAANTIVVRHPPREQPDLEQLLPDKFNSLREHPHLAARLRQRVGPQEAALLLEALMRRDDFDDDSRVSLFADLAQHFRDCVPFPEAASVGVSDEQYLRNVVDILYRDRQHST